MSDPRTPIAPYSPWIPYTPPPAPSSAPKAKKPAPSSAYTQDVAARGLQAVQERRQAAQFDRTQQPAAADWLQQSGYGGNDSNALYEEWLSQRGFHPAAYPVTFGQSKKGAYNGYKTEGELKAALLGNADLARESDQQQAQGLNSQVDEWLASIADQYQTGTDQATQLQAEADRNRDPYMMQFTGLAEASAAENRQLHPQPTVRVHPGPAPDVPQPGAVGMPGTSDEQFLGVNDVPSDALPMPVIPGALPIYDQYRQENDPTLRPPVVTLPGVGPTPPSVSEQMGGGLSGSIGAPTGSTQFTTIEPAPAPDPRFRGMTGNAAATTNSISDYQQSLNDWLASASDPYLNAEEAAQRIQQTPLRDYAQIAGAQMGIDPSLVAGWYPQSSQVGDYTQQRDLQSIQDYGMPYSEHTSLDNRQQSDADQAATQATKDQTAANEQAQLQLIGDTTGLDGKQLAATTNMTLEQVANIVADPIYQQKAGEIQDKINDPTFIDPNNPDSGQGVIDILNELRTDPELYALLSAQFADFVS